jgi:predicted transcriptional regulator
LSIEDVFSSKGRVRILKILTEIGELNISDIARRAKLNYTTTNNHLQYLENVEIIRHKRFGRIRIYQLNEENQQARIIRRLINLWGQNNKINLK